MEARGIPCVRYAEIARGPAAPPYTGKATAIPVGGTIWLSSVTDRIAYRALKR
jgi:hypothetical protein